MGAAFVGCRSGAADDSSVLYAGHAVFRELVRNPDGSLGTKWPAEMVPPMGEPLPSAIGEVTLDAHHPTAVLPEVPPNAAIAFRVDARAAEAGARDGAGGADGTLGVHLRGLSAEQPGYELRFRPAAGEFSLGRAGRSPEAAPNWSFARIENMPGLHAPFGVEIILKDDLIDICIDRRQTLCLRLPELRGQRMAFFLNAAPAASVRFSDIRICPLK
jgi:hypothetical protein